MKKILTLILALGMFNICAFAQGEITPTAGVEIALPMGDFGDVASLGAGISLGAEYGLNENMGIDLQAGYITMFLKDEVSDFFDNYSMIPVQAGFSYYLNGSEGGPYLKGMIGIHSSSVKTPEIDLGPFGNIPSETVSNTDLSFAPAVGFRTGPLDLNLRYQIISTEGESTSYLGFRGAYIIGGGN